MSDITKAILLMFGIAIGAGLFLGLWIFLPGFLIASVVLLFIKLFKNFAVMTWVTFFILGIVGVPLAWFIAKFQINPWWFLGAVVVIICVIIEINHRMYEKAQNENQSGSFENAVRERDIASDRWEEKAARQVQMRDSGYRSDQEKNAEVQEFLATRNEYRYGDTELPTFDLWRLRKQRKESDAYYVATRE